MAQEFSKWISSCLENLTEHLDDRLIIVGIIGNETTESRKFELINDYFKRSVFYDAFDAKFNNTEDDSYYISVCFMLLHYYSLIITIFLFIF